MSRTDDQVHLRVPDGLRAMVAEAAHQNRCSMNAEFVRRVEASFAKEASIASITEDLALIKRALTVLVDRS